MSTRATYKFTGAEIGSVTFYIHYDGYPEGAAEYFKLALDYENTAIAANSTFADRFYRANPRAEITPGADAHGDLDYSYECDIDSQTIQIYKMTYDADFSNERWVRWDKLMTVSDFVERFAEKNLGGLK